MLALNLQYQNELWPFPLSPREDAKVAALDSFGGGLGSGAGIEIEPGRESGTGDGSRYSKETKVSRDISAAGFWISIVAKVY